PAQDFRDFISEMDDGQTAGLLSRVGNCVLSPINVFSIETRHVSLRYTQMPAEFVEISPLRILFPLDDESMLLDRDGAFGLELNFRPQSLRDDRPWEPVHRQAEVVEFSKMNVRAHGAGFDAAEEVLGLGFDDDLVPDEIEWFLPACAKPSLLGRPLFGFHQRIQRILPGAHHNAGIASGQIRFGELEIDGGLAQRLVFREDDLLRSVAVFRLQTGAFTGLGIDAVEGRAAFAAVDQTETIFHRLSCSLPEKESEVLRCYGRVGVRWHD